MSFTIDLFAGCGGASLGFHRVGDSVLGVEVWQDAAESHRLAGMPCLTEDVRELIALRSDVDHLHASPPCTTFSTAGRGGGRRHVEELVLAVKRVLAGEPHGLNDPDETTLLTLEPARLLAEARPATISFEQVRAVLPVWEAYADGLRDLGYSVATGLISSETLGVPQTRVRAWLAARSDGKEARLPEATHSRYYPRDPERLDDDVAPWVSMAEALGWGASEVGFTPAGVTCPAKPRLAREPAHTITGAGNGYVLSSLDQRTGRGGKTDGRGNGARKLSLEEALALQGFPADFPLVGTQSSKAKQVGNAVPPPVAEAVLRELRS